MSSRSSCAEARLGAPERPRLEGRSLDGQVHDERRIAYLKAHLAAAARAITSGVDLRGYYL